MNPLSPNSARAGPLARMTTRTEPAPATVKPTISVSEPVPPNVRAATLVRRGLAAVMTALLSVS